MTGTSITIDPNAKALHSMASELSTVLHAVQDSLGDIGEHMIESTRQRFDDQTAPDGTAWDALADATVARKHRNPDAILREYGGLEDSIHTEWLDSSVEVGTNLIYAATHQFGADERNIPARPFMGVTADDEAEIAQIIRDALAGMM